jgi:hypothetical protein
MLMPEIWNESETNIKDRNMVHEHVWMYEVHQPRLNMNKLESINLFSYPNSILNSWKMTILLVIKDVVQTQKHGCHQDIL